MRIFKVSNKFTTLIVKSHKYDIIMIDLWYPIKRRCTYD